MAGKLLADRVCKDRGRDFGTLFQRQYVLSETPVSCPPGWSELRHQGWQLCHCPDLPVTEIHDDAQRPVGWFIGIAIGSHGRIFADDARLPVASAHSSFWAGVETVIAGLAGRYIAVIWNKAAGRVYTDPSCDMALVYDPTSRMAASSLLLALCRDIEENPRMPKLGPVHGAHNFALQQTPDKHARRAMANHYLCLENFDMRRFFPAETTRVSQGRDRLTAVCEEIAARLSEIMRALVARYACVIPITGGRDSRLILGACQPDFRETRFFVHHTGNFSSGLDCLIAREIARKLSIDLEIVDVAAPEHRADLMGRSAKRRRWDIIYSSGYQMAGKTPGDRLAPLLAPAGDVLIRGNVMELLRANQWKPGAFGKISVAHGLTKLRVAPTIDAEVLAQWGPDYETWMESLPIGARERIYDFAFCELLLPNTMGAMLSGHGRHFAMNAFNDRGLIMAALSMPPRLRRRGRMVERLSQILAGNLSDIDHVTEARKKPEWRAAYRQEFTPVYWNSGKTEAR